jgi:tetratricopeptide (TPR) repeat protein
MESIEARRSHFHQTGQHFADYFLRFADDHRNDWQELEAEYANLLITAQHCRNIDSHSNLVTLRDVLQPHLDLHGRWDDSLMLNEWVIAAAQSGGDQISVARFTHDRADILNQRGEYRQAEHLYQFSEEAYLALGEVEMALRSRHMRALVIRAQGRLIEAGRLCEATIVDALHLGLHRWLAHPLYVQALLARDWGDFQRARHCIEESLDCLTGSDELSMIAGCHHFLGELAFLEGHLAEARARLEKSLQLSRQVGILRRVAATQRLLGDVARAEGQHNEAHRLYREAFTVATRLGDRPQQARILLSRAQLASSLGHRREAIDLLQNANSTYRDIGDPRGVIGASLLLARLYMRQGQIRLAMRLGRTTFRVACAARLLRPRMLIGIVQRRGKW